MPMQVVHGTWYMVYSASDNVLSSGFMTSGQQPLTNQISPPRCWRRDSKRYRQLARPSLRVFILKELNAAVGAVWLRDYFVFVCVCVCVSAVC